jgi:predicted phage terminase large subunit-like protein
VRAATQRKPVTSRRQSLENTRAAQAKKHLRRFVKAAWPLVEAVPLVWSWHIDEICDALEAVSRGEISRLLINIPPGCMKSYLCSVFWPSWVWASDPSVRFLTSSYGAHLTIRDNLRVRNIVTSAWYRQHYPHVRLTDDQNVKVRFDTTERGWRIASSVGGVDTGEHPDYIIIDDPLSAKQGRSETYLETVQQWFDGSISTRGVARDVAIVVIMQRLHEEDLSGHLLQKGGWTHIMLPMHYDPKRADPRDLRSEAGELLWPRLFTEEAVRQMEIDLGPYGAAGQLEQRPAPEGGGLFKRSWLPIVDAGPAEAHRARGWDIAGTEGGGDWTAGVRWALTSDDIWYIEDVIRVQEEPGDIDKLIRNTAELDGKKCIVREEQEPGSSGKAVIKARAKNLKGFDYAGMPTSGDKATRANPMRAQAQAGNVRLVRGEWNEAFLQEAEVFDKGKHDDQIDAASCGFNGLVDSRPKTKGAVLW